MSAALPTRMTATSRSARRPMGWRRSTAPSPRRLRRPSTAGSRSSPSRCAPADPRTLDQRRADALAALTEGRRIGVRLRATGLPRPVRDDRRPPSSDRAGARVVINVVASEQTVDADGDVPGYLEGYGVIDAEQVRQLAAAASATRRRSVDQSGRGAAVSALRGTGAGRPVPGSDLPLPRVQPAGGGVRPRPHGPVQPSGSGGRWPDSGEIISNAFAVNIIGSRPSAAGATSNLPTAPWCGRRRADGPTGPRRPVPTSSHSRGARHARHRAPKRRSRSQQRSARIA